MHACRRGRLLRRLGRAGAAPPGRGTLPSIIPRRLGRAAAAPPGWGSGLGFEAAAAPPTARAAAASLGVITG
eukprot:scaffold40362_cov21-Phaeocystis_antarctica.AAC.1